MLINCGGDVLPGKRLAQLLSNAHVLIRRPNSLTMRLGSCMTIAAQFAMLQASMRLIHMRSNVLPSHSRTPLVLRADLFCTRTLLRHELTSSSCRSRAHVPLGGGCRLSFSPVTPGPVCGAFRALQTCAKGKSESIKLRYMT